jgi:hypothetical protein
VSIPHGALPDAPTGPADAFTPPDAEAMAVGHSRFTQGLDALAMPDHDAPNPQRHPNYRPLLAAPFSRVETARGLLLARGRDGALVTPLVAKDPAAPSERPAYSRTSAGRVLAEIDATTVEAAWADNTRLRAERDEALADAATQRALKQDALARLDTAKARIDGLETIVASLGGKLHAAEKAVRLLGEVVVHVDGHAAKHGQPDAGSEGGENDG